MNASQQAENTPPALLPRTRAQDKVRRVFAKVFGRHALNAALLVFFACALVGAVGHPTELIQDPDIWWHLANARLLFATHNFIHTDPYSFTVAGERWVNPEWLAEVPFWLGYKWRNLMGVHLVALAAFCANLLFIYFRSYWKSRNQTAAFWIAVLSFFLLSVNFGARTIGIAYLALSAEMAILEAAERGRTKLIWILPLLFCVWINLHGSWVIGLGLLGLYFVCRVFRLNRGAFEQNEFARGDRNRLVLVILASAAAIMVNPYGWRLIWNPFDMVLHQKVMLALTQEWQPLSLGTLVGRASAVFLGLTIAANFVRPRKWKLYELASFLFAWYMGFAHLRFSFLACVITAPMVTADVARSFMREPDEKTIPVLNALIIAAVIAGLVFLSPSETTLERDFAAARPLRAISQIQPSWRTLNEYSLGGIMDFESKPTFIDSRNDIFEHHGVLQSYLAITGLQTPCKLLEQYRIDHVLIPDAGPLAFALKHACGWRVVMRDRTYLLFARTESAGSQAAVTANR